MRHKRPMPRAKGESRKKKRLNVWHRVIWPSEATYLAVVQVITVGVELWVVLVENSRIDTVVVGYILANISWLHNVGLGAILALCSKAKLISRNEVGAFRVDLVYVDYGQLVAVRQSFN